MPDPEDVGTLTIELRASPEERSALRSALLAARASELAELRRRGGRLAFGYGSESARDAMGSEVDRLRMRHEMLDRLIAALEGEMTGGRR